jgi:hypothetical protein
MYFEIYKYKIILVDDLVSSVLKQLNLGTCSAP